VRHGSHNRANTLEDPHGGGEIINTSGGLEGGNDDGGGGYEIVGESVVEVALYIGFVNIQEASDEHATRLIFIFFSEKIGLRT
jgi:hypothetical protein